MSSDQKIGGRLDTALRRAGSSLSGVSTARHDQEVFRSAWDAEEAAAPRVAPEPVRQRPSSSRTRPSVAPADPAAAGVPELQI